MVEFLFLIRCSHGGRLKNETWAMNEMKHGTMVAVIHMATIVHVGFE